MADEEAEDLAEDGADGAAQETEGGDAELTEDELAEGLEKKKLSGRKLVLFVAVPLLVLGLGGGGAFIMLDSDEEHVAEEVVEEPIQFFELPEMLVTLNTAPGKRANYLKLVVSLEVQGAEGMVALEEQMPRVIDNFQVYLRELRVEDLSGSAGLYRLREELLTRVNTAVASGQVKDILFKEMLVQ